MYFIDSKKITKNLAYMDDITAVFEARDNWLEDAVSTLALERIANVYIEAIIDIGNTMIDGFIMRDPGSYEDIIDILVDEKAVPPEYDADLKLLLTLRRVLVRDILEVDDAEVLRVLIAVVPTIKKLRAAIEAFVEKEMGTVVTAFIPEED
ncbi:DUF86 domain-containing protein [Kurthia huakuii]|uniref:DUF86 domain-containing protein n=1 Tax=Kurthia huakuii TaxID=1421019 RepID=UPI00049773E6|nr:HepT-like ribonuclease domain-containing protein [Kurthia huakuii]MBM7700260.1 uncharacterized protein YutE (UPF0331/DUF86 family) [Kurthia huakuii]